MANRGARSHVRNEQNQIVGPSTRSATENLYFNLDSNKCDSVIYEEVELHQIVCDNNAAERPEQTAIAHLPKIEESNEQKDGDYSQIKRSSSKGEKNRILICVVVLFIITLGLNAGMTMVGLHFAKRWIVESEARFLQKAMVQWNMWSPWSGCSESRGTGLQRRNRTCLNSHPEHEGFQCPGDSNDYRSCSNTECSAKEQSVVFRAKMSSDAHYYDYYGYDDDFVKNHAVVFEAVLENQGRGYDSDTGIFTAPVDGNYLFYVHLCTHNEQQFDFSLMEDGDYKQSVQLMSNNKKSVCGTSVYMTQLKARSRVWFEHDLPHHYHDIFDMFDGQNVFSGILLQ